LIGIGFLALCLLGSDLLSAFTTNTFLRLLKESPLISGWVAMWRPLRIFLYDWWPFVHRRRIYRNLGHASLQVLPAKSQSDHRPSRSGPSPAHAMPDRTLRKDGGPKDAHE
jgi:hypothetical protein